MLSIFFYSLVSHPVVWENGFAVLVGALAFFPALIVGVAPWYTKTNRGCVVFVVGFIIWLLVAVLLVTMVRNDDMSILWILGGVVGCVIGTGFGVFMPRLT